MAPSFSFGSPAAARFSISVRRATTQYRASIGRASTFFYRRLRERDTVSRSRHAAPSAPSAALPPPEGKVAQRQRGRSAHEREALLPLKMDTARAARPARTALNFALSVHRPSMKLRIFLRSANNARWIAHSSLLPGAKLMLSNLLANGMGPSKPRHGGRRGSEASNDVCEVYGAARLLIVRPILTRLSEITPSATQRCIPASSFYRHRLRPFRRLTTLMRPSHRTPFLAIAEPALLLFALALRAFARSIGNAYPFDPHCSRSGLVPGRVEPGVSRHQPRHAPQLDLVGCDRAEPTTTVALRAPLRQCFVHRPPRSARPPAPDRRAASTLREDHSLPRRSAHCQS